MQAIPTATTRYAVVRVETSDLEDAARSARGCGAPGSIAMDASAIHSTTERSA
ncbi:hypothetical protein GCM10009735_86070 [Actinomadura chokoriensis]